jgi:glycerophosphoryl diester phosphodiesterase
MPRKARENTLAAFALALEAGADGIELDVHLTRDGTVVVHHDEALRDGRAIARHSLSELGGSPYEVPTLNQVFQLVRGRAELFVEIKGRGIEKEVAALLDGYAGPAALHSFDHAAIARLHASGTTHRLGVLLDRGSREDAVQVMSACGALDVWPHHSLVTADLVQRVRARGGRVIVWTVNRARLAKSLIALGVDGVCSDDIARLPDHDAV